jgi:hypothetical protein
MLNNSVWAEAAGAAWCYGSGSIKMMQHLAIPAQQLMESNGDQI